MLPKTGQRIIVDQIIGTSGSLITGTGYYLVWTSPKDKITYLYSFNINSSTASNTIAMVHAVHAGNTPSNWPAFVYTRTPSAQQIYGRTETPFVLGPGDSLYISIDAYVATPSQPTYNLWVAQLPIKDYQSELVIL